MSDGLQFSPVAFALALVTVSLGTAAGLAFVPVVGTYFGTLAGAFVAGLGVLAAGPFVGSGIGAAVAGLAAVSPLTLLVSVALSFAVGAFGAHFGDDLRDGLTETVEEPDSGSTDISDLGVAPLTESAEDEIESIREATDESATVKETAADDASGAGEKELE
ncbi:hypothetical protein BRC69_04900 [Halobacteriales archaeon QH_6_66_25]|nr:MAG: hypothetical protein BRC69_04900 [Halobacteriales archaeon QH_6_66_25]